MSERANAVQESFEDCQTDTAEALQELFKESKGMSSESKSRLRRAFFRIEEGTQSILMSQLPRNIRKH
jgi:hypothetical protein